MKKLINTLLFLCVLKISTLSQDYLFSFDTLDGRIFKNSTILRKEHDKIIISFNNKEQGIGVASIYATNLPLIVRTNLGLVSIKPAEEKIKQEKAPSREGWTPEDYAIQEMVEAEKKRLLLEIKERKKEDQKDRERMILEILKEASENQERRKKELEQQEIFNGIKDIKEKLDKR